MGVAGVKPYQKCCSVLQILSKPLNCACAFYFNRNLQAIIRILCFNTGSNILEFQMYLQ